MPPVLREQIAALTDDEKLQLAQELWDEAHEKGTRETISDELLAELDRRSARFAANPGSGYTLDEVIARAKARHGR